MSRFEREEPEIDLAATLEERAEQLVRWVYWARRRMEAQREQLEEQSRRIAHEASIAADTKIKLQKAEDDIRAYQRVVESRKGLSIIEIGRSVSLTSDHATKVRILKALVNGGGLVRYKVGYWAERQWVEVWLDDSEIMEETPLADVNKAYLDKLRADNQGVR